MVISQSQNSKIQQYIYSYVAHVQLNLLLSDGRQGDRSGRSIVRRPAADEESDSVSTLFQNLSNLLTAQAK